MAEETKFSASLSQLHQIDALQGTQNYIKWKQDMQDFLILIELWHYVEAGKDYRPAAAETAKWTKAHTRICTMMRTRCKPNARDKLEDITNAAEAWEKLEEYKPQGSGLFNLQAKKLQTLTLASCDNDPQLYADKFSVALREFKTQHGKLLLDENIKIFWFHSGLGPSYDNYWEQYSQNHDTYDRKGHAKYTLDYAITRFLNTVVNPSGPESKAAQALAAIAEGAYGHTPQSVTALVAKGSSEHKIQDGANSTNSRTYTMTVKHCTICGKDYHSNAEHSDQPPKRKRDGDDNGHRGGNRGGRGGRSRRGGNRGRGGNSNGNKNADSQPSGAGAAVATAPIAQCFVALSNTTALTASTSFGREQATALSTAAAMSSLWLRDCACTQHMAHNASVFKTFQQFNPPRPVDGLAGSKMATGFGNIELACKVNGSFKTWTLRDVWLVPGCGYNLISEGQLEEQGYSLSFVDNGIAVGKGRFFFRRTTNRLYALDTWEGTPLAMAVINRDIPACDGTPLALLIQGQTPEANSNGELNPETLRMWHARHGHLCTENLKKLAGMSVGMDLSLSPPSDACEPYSVANMKVESHKRPIAPGRWENDLIHSDIQGPFATSHDGYAYMITFLDDKTLRSGLYLLPDKSGPTVLSAFKMYLNEVEHGECKCTRLRSDCGSEYDNYKMEAYRLSKGITWEGTVPGNPQMNGKSERLGQTIQQKASAMLKESGLPQKYWTEFVRTANTLRNLQPVTGRDVIPHEASTGNKPDVSHLRIIGQTGFCQVVLRNTGWKKYQDRAVKARLLGYQGKFYRMLFANGEVAIVSNVKWIDNVPPKPTPFQLGEDAADNTQPGELRKRRMLEAHPEQEPAVPGEKRQKRQGTLDDDEITGFLNARNNPELNTRSNPEHHICGNPEPEHRPTTRSMTTTRDEIPAARASDILRSHRDISPDPLALLAKANASEPFEPRTYKEAMADAYHKMIWELAMQDEVQSLLANGTWTLVDLPSNARALGGRWVFKLKRGPAGGVIRYKARWVVRGFEQREGIDFNETFASVVKPMSYKAIFALAAALDWELEQMDVKTAFLYGNVEEVVYVMQPSLLIGHLLAPVRLSLLY